MTFPIVIELAGHPRGKGRPRRARLKNGMIITHTPTVTAEYESNLRFAAAQAMAGRPPIDGSVGVMIEAFYPVPKSWSKKRQREALAGTILPTVTPDLCNIFGVTDGCNGVVWHDDRQIVEAMLTKVYSDRPRLVLSVWPVHMSSVASRRGALVRGSQTPADTLQAISESEEVS